MSFDLFSMRATATLIVDGGRWLGSVNVHANTIDGLVPHILTLRGDPDLMDAARGSSDIQLQLLELKFNVRIATATSRGSLVIFAELLYLAMAKYHKLNDRRWPA